MPKDLSPLFVCSWGDIQLFADSIEWDAGETQVVHDLANGDVHPVQPRGSHLRKSTLKLIFDEFEGATETGYEAYRRFAASTKERRIFTHPMDGSYFAVIGDFKPTIDNSSIVSASCEFIPDGQVQPVSPAGAGTTGTSGESSVAASTDLMAIRLSDQGIGFRPDKVKRLNFSLPIDLSIALAFSVDISVTASFSANISASGSASATGSATASATATATASASVQASATASAFAFANVFASALATANASAVAEASGMASANAFAFAMACAALDVDVRASVASWNQEDVPTRKVLIDAARLSESISTMIDQGGFEHDLEFWPAFRAAILLGESIRSAAIAATSETLSVFVMRVQDRTALLSIAAKIYGGFDAQARARQIASLNDISTVGWLDPGDYLMPARPRSDSSALLGEAQ